MREAEVHLMQLVNMLRGPGVAALPGSVAIVAVKAAGSIALQRPFFFSKVLPVLLAVTSAQVRALIDDLNNNGGVLLELSSAASARVGLNVNNPAAPGHAPLQMLLVVPSAS